MNKPKNYTENKSQGMNPTKGHLIISETYEGQLPSPEMMEQYNHLDGSFANRILQMAENEQKHNHKIALRTSTGLLLSMAAGMVFAFLSVLVVSYLVYLCIDKGYSTTAGSIAVGVIVGIAGVFVYQRKKNNTTEK